MLMTVTTYLYDMCQGLTVLRSAAAVGRLLADFYYL